MAIHIILTRAIDDDDEEDIEDEEYVYDDDYPREHDSRNTKHYLKLIIVGS